MNSSHDVVAGRATVSKPCRAVSALLWVVPIVHADALLPIGCDTRSIGRTAIGCSNSGDGRPVKRLVELLALCPKAGFAIDIQNRLYTNEFVGMAPNATN
jgi:hypothetical protein